MTILDALGRLVTVVLALGILKVTWIITFLHISSMQVPGQGPGVHCEGAGGRQNAGLPHQARLKCFQGGGLPGRPLHAAAGVQW